MLDAGQLDWIAVSSLENNFDFCICIRVNLCYGVYIPVEEGVEHAASDAGSSLRHWPPGTNS
jgi:hypothetical protein